MKIAVLVEFFPPKLGSDRRIYEIMSRLTDGHEIHFVVLPPFRVLSGQFMISDNQLHNHLGSDHSREASQAGLKSHYMRIPRLLAKIWKRSYTLAYPITLCLLLPRVVLELRKIRPDVVVLNYPSIYTGILGFAAGRILKKPVLLDFNDLIAQYSILLMNLKNSSAKAKIFVKVQDFLVRKSDKLVATTELIKKYALSCGAARDRIFVIPNGVDTKLFRPMANNGGDEKSKIGLSGKTVCLYGGRLDSWAGIDIIMGLCKELEDKAPDAHFLVVGGKLENHEAPQNLLVLDETAFNDMPQILNIADAILVPFPDNIVSHASSPLKLFEGMAMKKPVVASKVEGIEEVIKDGVNGVLVDRPNSISRWCKAVESVLNSKKLARKVANGARQTVVEKYDWNTLAQEYEKVFMG